MSDRRPPPLVAILGPTATGKSRLGIRLAQALDGEIVSAGPDLAQFVVMKAVSGTLTAREALPMQLCDWALIAVVGALLWRSQTCFELGYFWGLCGTLQALFTPAISRDLAWWKQAAIFLDHAGIVAGVLFLLLVPKMRPLGMGRIVLWSEIYIASALAVNALTGGNYGFLSHRPEQASLLDLFPDARWLYVATINAVALVFFTAIYLPWLCVQRRRSVGG